MFSAKTKTDEWKNKKYRVPPGTKTRLKIVFSIIGLIAIGMAEKMTIRG
jgi:hypothetical protein